MSLRHTLDLLAGTVERAGSVPLSASCLVNRAEMLALVEQARAELPAELDEAEALLISRQDMLDDVERERREVLARARERADAMVGETAIALTAEARAEQILQAARTEAARLLRQADDYADRRLAAFETDLDRAMAQVRRGRDRLRERSDLDAPPEPEETEAGSGHGSDRALRDPVGVAPGKQRTVIDVAALERAARSGLGEAANLQ
jgi:uncharacterized protein YhaN